MRHDITILLTDWQVVVEEQELSQLQAELFRVGTFTDAHKSKCALCNSAPCSDLYHPQMLMYPLVPSTVLPLFSASYSVEHAAAVVRLILEAPCTTARVDWCRHTSRHYSRLSGRSLWVLM
jgi:hypothetical protein